MDTDRLSLSRHLNGVDLESSSVRFGRATVSNLESRFLVASTTIKINYLTKGVLADGWVFAEEIGSDGFALVYKMTKEAEFPQKE